MNEQFVNYKQSLQLKELGFEEPCFARYIKKEFKYGALGGVTNFTKEYDNQISAPLYQQVFEWFREKYNIDGWVVPCKNLDDEKSYTFIIDLLNYIEEMTEYNTYNEAEIACINKLIELIQK
jgi:hypothetical protein